MFVPLELEAADLRKMNDEVILLYKQGKLQQAARLGKRALLNGKQNYGQMHPLVAVAFNNLGKVYHSLGKYKNAEPLYKRALYIVENKFGSQSRYVPTFLANLGALQFSRGKYNESKRYYLRALFLSNGSRTDKY